MIKLSENFWLAEFTDSQTATRLGIDNAPDDDTLERLRNTAFNMEAVRKALGTLPINISSGYRCPALNTAVGGKSSSQHLTGEAVDFTCRRFGTIEQIVDHIKRTNIQFDQLINEYGRWVHISFKAPVNGVVQIQRRMVLNIG